MKHLSLILLFFICLTILQAQQSSGSENRVALVMGNSSYLSGPLKNTVNDARAIALALESAGFEVILQENVRNQNDMKKAVRDFGMRLKTGGTALFYYSGHGMQVEGFNYLIPIQAVMNIVEEIEYEALDVGFVLAYMESAKSDVNIVILDACRNNPFARSFRDTQQGLSGMV
ncbi:MAG: caspase family protein, partial [Bacteroidales bacterium]|nr:caspase family protein [Bacteroidales bacterium]